MAKERVQVAREREQAVRARERAEVAAFAAEINAKVERGLPPDTKPDVVCACGRGYAVRGGSRPQRDKDEARCEDCGEMLEAWNGGVSVVYWRIGPRKAK
jgi:hypothetical protein